MLNTLGLTTPNFSANLILVSRDNVINEVSGNSKVGAKIISTSGKNHNPKTTNSKFFIKPNHDFSSKKGFRSGFFTLKARLAFTKWRQMFVKVLILNYFDKNYHIWIEIDRSNYVMSGVLSQLVLDDLG